jgi:hypothetical protein
MCWAVLNSLKNSLQCGSSTWCAEGCFKIVGNPTHFIVCCTHGRNMLFVHHGGEPSCACKLFRMLILNDQTSNTISPDGLHCHQIDASTRPTTWGAKSVWRPRNSSPASEGITAITCNNIIRLYSRYMSFATYDLGWCMCVPWQVARLTIWFCQSRHYEITSGVVLDSGTVTHVGLPSSPLQCSLTQQEHTVPKQNQSFCDTLSFNITIQTWC